MTDSDSSEDENLKFLQEAVDTQFISDSLYKNTPKEPIKDVETPKSLRITKQEDVNNCNLLNLTPGVQKYVAKQLESFLERSLSKQLADLSKNNAYKKRKRKKSKVRLFSNSQNFIDLKSEALLLDSVVINKKPKLKCEFDSDDEKNIKLVVVESKDVLSKKEVSNWAKSTRTKQIFKYKMSKNGTTLLEM